MQTIKYYLDKICQNLNYIKVISSLKMHYKLLIKYKNNDYIFISMRSFLGNYFFEERIPVRILEKKGKSFYKNNKFNSGKKILLFTNSSNLFLDIVYQRRALLNNMDNQGSSSIDIYVYTNNQCVDYCVYPDNNCTMRIKKEIYLGAGKHKIEIYLPNYASIKDIYIGYNNDSYVEKGEYDKNTIIVYGSSVSQGCAASRPSFSYVHKIGNYYNAQILNFGFSESANGEQDIIEYIANFSPSLFILEYDHNVSIDVLQSTHERVYRQIRQRNNMVPIIFMSRFSGGMSISYEEENERVKIINNTYEKAVSSGDQYVEFVSGKDVFKDKFKFFVDDRHPNDEGMQVIADLLIQVIDKRGFIK